MGQSLGPLAWDRGAEVDPEPLAHRPPCGLAAACDTIPTLSNTALMESHGLASPISCATSTPTINPLMADRLIRLENLAKAFDRSHRRGCFCSLAQVE